MEESYQVIPDDLKELIQEYDQNHLLKYISEYSNDELSEFEAQLRKINFKLLKKLYDELCVGRSEEEDKKDEPIIEPISREDIFENTRLSEEERNHYRQIGCEQIIQGKVAVLLLAGGQGTRLGFNHPKGKYKIGLPSDSSIFQILVNKFLGAQKLDGPASKKCEFYIMTSENNHEETMDYFYENNNLGIQSENIHFFKQPMIPALDFSGKIIMESKNEISFSPNGNGGLFDYLEKDESIFTQMIEKGVEYLQIIGVDNVLCKLLDPIFIGISKENNFSCGIKTIPKAFPTEKIGSFVKLNGKIDLIEYSMLDDEEASKTDSEGHLLYNYGNILNFLINLNELLDLSKKNASSLTSLYNLAIKKINHIDENGEFITATENCGYKFELFIHSFLKFVSGPVGLIQVQREEEFAPVKNPPGSATDSPDTARKLISQSNIMKLLKSGAAIKEFGKSISKQSEEEAVCEIDARLSYDGENLSQFHSKEIILPVYLQKPQKEKKSKKFTDSPKFKKYMKYKKCINS